MEKQVFVKVRVISKKKTGRGYSTSDTMHDAPLNRDVTLTDMARLFEAERALNELTGLRVHIDLEEREVEG